MSSTQIANPTLFRENVRSKLIERFGKDANPTILANVEIGVYNYAIKEASNLKIIKNTHQYDFHRHSATLPLTQCRPVSMSGGRYRYVLARIF